MKTEERRKEAKRKCTEGEEGEREEERERDQGRQKSQPRGDGSLLPRHSPGLAASRPCWGMGTGRRRSPGKGAECLRDVFIP